ncbi:D-Ala-D-Ala carboxypeptidase family metallohydrolase [Sphingomicrobium sediminis]|uniref:D-Ala-D-Ala carboxypeptidase family metallohydrolase n=1 Tax=Sphingomicrobium sediminis TaxID=2950949 RepID=A0A9X2EHX7_9SPHN|nr:D-Ala-D-Ala carboxypeptidase family metallohydrolase [Sphingomicrobium sediminis]MCM8557826.1 D-Ala-D-Ala carboxypeptidase family metallohydrolase [Sphingomicrobium sediminis]
MLGFLGLALNAPSSALPPEASVRMFDPATPYLNEGQSEQAFQGWLQASPARASRVATFEAYLEARGVGSVFPSWQLLRTASSWRDCGAAPFEVPPRQSWDELVETLDLVRDVVIPNLGQVEPLSGYRNPYLNNCAGGSRASAHRGGAALDLVPVIQIERVDLMRRLCILHGAYGREREFGLGVYAGIRFHVDASGYRSWGLNVAEGGRACEWALERRESARVESDEVD